MFSISIRDNLEWTKWNAPYFNDPLYDKQEFIENIGPMYYFETDDNGLVLYNKNTIGTVSYSIIDGNIKQWIEI